MEGHENLSEVTKESLTSLKTLATQFLEAFSAWELVDSNLGNQLQEVGESSKLPENVDVEQSLQIQQIHDVEPVSTNMSGIQQDARGEASQWINAHIMELSATYGECAMLKWKVDVYCLQETKVTKEMDSLAKHETMAQQVDAMWVYGNKWKGSLVKVGQFSITYKFEAMQDSFSWFLTGVYAPHIRSEKLECWEEVEAVKELCEGPWVTWTSTLSEPWQKGKWIDEMKLHDPYLCRENFTWFRGPNHHSATRLDRFLYSIEWEEFFKNTKQMVMPRVTSDHCLILLQCGDWLKQRSYFKFENWWLEIDGFRELVHKWWNEFEFEVKDAEEKNHRPEQISMWELDTKKRNLLAKLADIDLVQDTRALNEDEMMGYNNIIYFQRMATAHKRYNAIDKLVISGEDIKDPDQIKVSMIEFYKNLYSESENWRPSFEIAKLS
ncbi:hypothetical protein H5410_029313 [Solanum commersonii]|uniref:Uncharacterized protein n=1 Tax=Solanum commersonii TaxID=4109 RepID=A0A9J5Z6F9_SOLCO|nr:hypothetical protein H5410_029313 [Solanum commersonii]